MSGTGDTSMLNVPVELQLTITPTQQSSLWSLIARVSSQRSGGTAVLRTAEQFTAELHAAHCTPCDDQLSIPSCWVTADLHAAVLHAAV